MSKQQEFEDFEIAFCKQNLGITSVMTMYDKETLRKMCDSYLKHRLSSLSNDKIHEIALLEQAPVNCSIRVWEAIKHILIKN